MAKRTWLVQHFVINVERRLVQVKKIGLRVQVLYSGRRLRLLNSFCPSQLFDRGKKKSVTKYFKPSVKKFKTGSEKPEKEVKINVGVLAMKDGNLSVKRGVTLPLSVSPKINSENLLRKAVDKHNRFNNKLISSTHPSSYRLFYQDKTEWETCQLDGCFECRRLQDMWESHEDVNFARWTSTQLFGTRNSILSSWGTTYPIINPRPPT